MIYTVFGQLGSLNNFLQLQFLAFGIILIRFHQGLRTMEVHF